MINLHQLQKRKRWTLDVGFPDIKLPTSFVKIQKRPTFEIQEERTEEGTWQARLDLSKWAPVKVTFLPPLHKDLINVLLDLWQSRVISAGWSSNPALKGQAEIRMQDGYGHCFEKWILENAWISGLDENELESQTATNISLEITYDSVLYDQPDKTASIKPTSS